MEVLRDLLMWGSKTDESRTVIVSMGGERVSNHSDIPEGPGQPVVDLEDNDGTEEFVEGGQSEFGGEKPWKPEAPSFFVWCR